MHAFSLAQEQQWDPKKHVEKILGEVEDGDYTVACWEPGQISPNHCHPHATEIYQNSGNYLTSLQGYDHIKTAASTISKTWIKVIEAGVTSGAFRDDIPPRVLYRLIRDSLWLSVRWFKPTHQYSMKRFADDFVSTFLEGIVPR